MLVPVRTDDIRLIAEHFKNKYRGYTIDEVAADEDIIPIRLQKKRDTPYPRPSVCAASASPRSCIRVG
jgi:hypothetical protein